VLFWLSWLLPALAQEGDDPADDIDIEESDEPVAPRKPAPPPVEEDDEPLPADDADEADEDLEGFRDTQVKKGEDLLSEEEQVRVSADTEQVYRKYVAAFAKLEPDEELAGWEDYLAKYPESAYRKRIEARMEELSDEMYESRIPSDGEDGPVDALRQEVKFSQALQLENINPRTRLQAGFEFGLPTYINLVVDYEHAVTRTFSVHGGVRRRYLGYNLEAGVRWAMVKSVRTGTLLTLIGDARFNTDPAYPALRPQLAFGKRAGPVDFQLQAGVDLAYRPELSGFQPTIVGGGSMFFRVNEGVGWFLETSSYMKPSPPDAAFDGGLFRFNVISFGFKFFPNKKGNQEVNTGATVPYMQQWWQFHYGSVMGQFNWYPEG
jgi:hypothetical protein